MQNEQLADQQQKNRRWNNEWVVDCWLWLWGFVVLALPLVVDRLIVDKCARRRSLTACLLTA